MNYYAVFLFLVLELACCGLAFLCVSCMKNVVEDGGSLWLQVPALLFLGVVLVIAAALGLSLLAFILRVVFWGGTL